jgi:hypothetical protein
MAFLAEVLEDASTGFESVHDGHVDVQHNDRVVVARLAAHHLQSLHAVLSLIYLKVRYQLLLVGKLQKFIVVHKKHARLSVTQLSLCTFRRI